jgi:hypothetical protein
MEQAVSSGIVSDMYSGDAWFESEPRHRLSRDFLVVLLDPSRQVPDSTLNRPLVFFLVSWGGVRLGTSATIWSIVPAPDDR